MYVARFQNKSGVICQVIDDSAAEAIISHKPDGTPVAHAYGGCLIVWRVPKEWESEAIWRAESGWLKDHIVWEWNGVGMTPA